LRSGHSPDPFGGGGVSRNTTRQTGEIIIVPRMTNCSEGFAFENPGVGVQAFSASDRRA